MHKKTYYFGWILGYIYPGLFRMGPSELIIRLTASPWLVPDGLCYSRGMAPGLNWSFSSKLLNYESIFSQITSLYLFFHYFYVNIHYDTCFSPVSFPSKSNLLWAFSINIKFCNPCFKLYLIASFKSISPGFMFY